MLAENDNNSYEQAALSTCARHHNDQLYIVSEILTSSYYSY